MSNVFHFQQFSVDQTGCAMKVNTDGVLLGALTQAENPRSILDIGTGTGVIALMLAQRFPKAQLEAVEIDQQAAETAKINFKASSFSNRLKAYHTSFQEFSAANADKKYDVIVSNPPFFTNSSKNPDKQKQVARHAEDLLFQQLIEFVRKHLNASGSCYFILPLEAANTVIEEGQQYGIQLQGQIFIKSSIAKPAHRRLIKLGFESLTFEEESFIIYESQKVYSDQYKSALKDFLTIFKE